MTVYKAGQDRGDVYCNGSQIQDVEWVDTKKGVACVHCKDEDGRIVLDGDMIRRRHVYGDMSFVPYEELQ